VPKEGSSKLAKRLLTDAFIRSLKAAPPGKRIAHWDTSVGPGFGVRVTDRGVKTFVLYTGPGASKYKLGRVDRMSLADARAKARDWLSQLQKGINPHEEAKRAKAETQLAKQCTFGAVVEAFLAESLSTKRQGRKDAGIIHRHILPKWFKRPISEITRSDVIALIKPLALPVPTTAHHVRELIGRIFNWAITQDIYGVEHNPTNHNKVKSLVGKRRIKTRTLDDRELRALWHACDDDYIKYPYGALYKLLMLTGTRLNEAARAKWTEFDLAASVWTIPAARYKSEQEHRLPLSDDAVALFKSLPRFAGNDFVFTFGSVNKPVNSFSKARVQITKLMTDKLGELAPFDRQDIRRTVRTRLSPLAPHEVCELIIGHAKRGLARVYDQHRYEGEQRKALNAWARRLGSLVQGSCDNVVELRKGATG
jgi:integrase